MNGKPEEEVKLADDEGEYGYLLIYKVYKAWILEGKMKDFCALFIFPKVSFFLALFFFLITFV